MKIVYNGYWCWTNGALRADSYDFTNASLTTGGHRLRYCSIDTKDNDQNESEQRPARWPPHWRRSAAVMPLVICGGEYQLYGIVPIWWLYNPQHGGVGRTVLIEFMVPQCHHFWRKPFLIVGCLTVGYSPVLVAIINPNHCKPEDGMSPAADSQSLVKSKKGPFWGPASVLRNEWPAIVVNCGCKPYV